MYKKIENLIDGTKGIIGEIVAEDIAPALATEMLKGTAIEAATGAVSAISPRIGGVMLAYKQKRWEHNWECFLQLIAEKQEELNAKLEKLEENQKDDIKSKYFPLISDYVGDEKQKEKIDFIVNGFQNMVSGANLQEDTLLMYYDTLNQISLLDIRVLKCYVNNSYIGDESVDTVSKVMKEYNIDVTQVRMIKEKLERLGLLESRNDVDMDSNIREMAKYLETVHKGKKAPNLKLKKINKNESFRATSFGRKFINFFTNEYKTEGEEVE